MLYQLSYQSSSAGRGFKSPTHYNTSQRQTSTAVCYGTTNSHFSMHEYLFLPSPSITTPLFSEQIGPTLFAVASAKFFLPYPHLLTTTLGCILVVTKPLGLSSWQRHWPKEKVPTNDISWFKFAGEFGGFRVKNSCPGLKGYVCIPSNW